MRQAYPGGGGCDVLVALHAWRSRGSVRRFRSAHPDRPIVVALTGTDLYRDLDARPAAGRSLATADRIVALQPQALAKLPPALRRKTRVIYQSAEALRRTRPSRSGAFDVAVLAHLRPVKDPFRAARAARLLPVDSRLRVLHAGRALTPSMERQARAEMKRNRRYRWLGELSPTRARGLLDRCRVLVLSSLMEGGANVVAEAIASGRPVLCSRIPGSVGMLGGKYPGYFPPGDSDALARLLRRVETDGAFLARLESWCRKLRSRFNPRREESAWESLLREVARRG